MFRDLSIFKIGKALIISFLLGLMAALFLKGCSIGGDRLTSMQIGTVRWPGFDVALYAQEAKLFKQRGLDIEFAEFDVTQDSVRSLIRGNVDAAFVALWELMQVDAGDDPFVYLMLTNISHGSDGVVVTSDIESVEQLKGKTVGTKLGTVGHLILLEGLKHNKMNPEDVKIKDISPPVAIQDINEGKIDAAVLWEPDLSQTAEAIGGNIPFTTKDVDSLVIDGLVTRKSYLKEHKKELIQFILAWFDLMQEIEVQPEVVFGSVGELLQQTGESFAEDYSGLKKGDIAMNRRMFSENHLSEATDKIVELLREDTRHNRNIFEDIQIEPELVMSAIETWENEGNQ